MTLTFRGRLTLVVTLALPFVVGGVLVVRGALGLPTDPYAWATVGFFAALSTYLSVYFLRAGKRSTLVAAGDEGLVEEGRLVAPWLAVTSVRWLRDWVEIRASSDTRLLRAAPRDPDEQQRVIELARRRAPPGVLWGGEGGSEFPLRADRRATIAKALVVAAIFVIPLGLIFWRVIVRLPSGRLGTAEVSVMAAVFAGTMLIGLVPLLHRYVTQLRVHFNSEGVMRGTELAVPWQQITRVVVRPLTVVIGTAARRTAVFIDLDCWPEPGRVLAALRRYAPPGAHVKPGLM